MELDARIEAVLFFRGEGVTVAKLAKFLNASSEDVEQGIKALEQKLSGRGIVLMRKDDEVLLGTAPEAGPLIEAITKEELTKDLGKAGIETLAVVLYQGPITRGRIDYIRGVNSTFILRNLLVRGLVERIPNPDDQRSFLYRPSFELLSHLGITRREDMPEYADIVGQIEQFMSEGQKTTEAQEQLGETAPREEHADRERSEHGG